MRGWVFENLPALEQVDLYENECIDKSFSADSDDKIQDLPKTVNGTCGIDPTENRISCERINPREKLRGFICVMYTYTAVQDLGYIISSPFNDEIKEIVFEDNRNIEFLPNSPHQIFPDLNFYHAARCAIREVSKSNFENLHQLYRIDLSGNHIYAVLSDTFEGLADLRLLDLSKLEVQFKDVDMFYFDSYLQARTKSSS